MKVEKLAHQIADVCQVLASAERVQLLLDLLDGGSVYLVYTA